MFKENSIIGKKDYSVPNYTGQINDYIKNYIKVKVPSLNKNLETKDQLENSFKSIVDKSIQNYYQSSLMEILPSTIEGAGMGTFAKKFIPKNTDLGEYFGEITPIKPNNTDYTWSFFENVNGTPVKKFVDALNFKENNPLRYVNSAKNEQQRPLLNTKFFMSEGRVHYLTTRDIKSGEELFIDYGKKYWSSRNKNIQKGGCMNCI